MTASTRHLHTILVVDDLPDIRTLIAEFVEDELGHTATCASNGVEAMSILEAGHIDLVVTDQWMPLMTGAQMVMKMQMTPEIAAIPVLMMSSEPIETFAADLPVAACLTKPFSFSLLQNLIAVHLRRCDHEEAL